MTQFFNEQDMTPIAQEAISIGLEELRKEASQMFVPNIEEVRQAALSFCHEYEQAQKEYQTWLSSSGKTKSRRKQNEIMLLSGARAAFDVFQNKINAYFHQMMKIMYVYMDPKTGAITLSVLDNSVSALTLDPNYGAVQYHLNEIKNVFQIEDYDSVLLDAAEQSIYSRWQIAKQHTKKSRYLPILWRAQGGWAGAKINNLGTIAEAYVNFYINKYIFTSNLEENVGIYILHPTYGAVAVDNASGFLIGDTSIDNIHFAVKKETASPMNLKKVYDETKKILALPVFSPEYLKKIFVDQEKEKVKAGQQAQEIKNLSRALGNTADAIISDIKNSIKKT